MHPSILGLASFVPSYCFQQDEAAKKIIEILSITEPLASQVRKLYANSAINQRYSVVGDFKLERAQWHFWGKNFPNEIPGMSQRNQLFKVEAPKMAFESAKRAIADWGGEVQKITHILFVTCTGVVAPGVEFSLIAKLGLKEDIQRYSISFMGCFGAFKGLALASSIAKENSSHRVLVICTELCSLHFQTLLDNDNLTANAIFADGSAAAIVGMAPKSSEKPVWEMVKSSSLAMANSQEKMSWEASDHGFLMRLSHQVPVFLGRSIKKFAAAILDPYISSDQCDWAIHPGGKSILQAIEKAMELTTCQTTASWDTLANYGNMSSATFLFVLDKIRKNERAYPWTFGVGFGPGLSMEGILLKKT